MQNQNEMAIEIDHLTRRFGEKKAVTDLTLEVYRGEVFGFLGHNGAGKTTTVRLLNGVLESHAGTAKVLGLDPICDGPQLRAHTGVLTESASLEERLSARDNLRLYADIFGVPRELVTSRVRELLGFFGLADNTDEKVANFSTGMKQRLALARTLLHDPEILFLDEPTAGLDPVAAQQVNDLIIQLAGENGCTVFLCTHNLVEAQRVCDRVAVMEQGKLAALGTPQELAHQYVHRLNVKIETDPNQLEDAIHLLSQTEGLLLESSLQVNGHISVTVFGRQAIPDILSLLVGQGVRIYNLAANEPTLEDVYFALHGEKEAQR